MKRWPVLLLIIFVLTACGQTTSPVPTKPPATTQPTPNLPTSATTPTVNAAPTATSQPASSQLKPGNSRHTLNFEGLERNYIVHLPPAITSQKTLPLVLMLHPAVTNSEIMAFLTGMNSKADSEGFITVYPNGTGTNSAQLYWNTGNCCYSAMVNKINDVGFLRTLLENIEKNYPVDPKRIYIAGMSNGGMMAYRLAAELADKVAAIGAVVGAMSGLEPPPAQPVSVISFNGLQDRTVPYNGAISRPANSDSFTEFKPVSFATNFWVKNNGANPQPQKEETADILKETYSGGKNGTEVVLYTMKNGGHAWPGANGQAAKAGEISATDVIWEFFKNHPKR